MGDACDRHAKRVGVTRNIAFARGLLGSVAFLCALLAFPANAARPLLDQHQWDRYFALSARDVEVPWKPASVRLAVYSGAPVDFALYNVDPAEVIIAGQHRSARAIDTRGRRPLARWRFQPPPGYRFEVSRVPLPLGAQEGFYVVEARRGDATQQVWINRTHIGLITKENTSGPVLWCVDLRDGRVLRGVNIALLVGRELLLRRTDERGVIVWNEHVHPTFALADHGAARAFVSLLPQAPLPRVIVGLRLESAAARAGENVHFIGFVRRRSAGAYRRADGDVRISLVGNGRAMVQTTVRLDEAGAFSGVFAVPATAESGEYAVLSSVVGGEGVAGTSLHVDAGRSVTLMIHVDRLARMGEPVALKIIARGEQAFVPGLPIAIRILRTPHVVPPGEADDTSRWGTTVVYEKTVRTDEHGTAHIVLLPPTDGLASSYGVRASARGATAVARVTVADSVTALAIEPDAENAAPGDALGFSVRGFDAVAGIPAMHLHVRVRLAHGPVSQERELVLDERGRGHVVFTNASLGTDLAFAQAQGRDGRTVLDITAVKVDSSNRDVGVAEHVSSSHISLDRANYRVGDRITVTANFPGASGDALITLEGERVSQMRVAKVRDGKAVAVLKLIDVLGAVQVAVAVVRNGAVVVDSIVPTIDAPGHARDLRLHLERPNFSPGEQARLLLHEDGGVEKSTVLVRVADGRESEPAYLDDAPDLLAVGGTTTQNPASPASAWHTFVVPAGSSAADVYAAERPRMQRVEDFTLGAAAPHTLWWHVQREENGRLTVPLPDERGRYLLSLLCIGDDGGVGASSISVNVQ
jgi:hypothetical protein